MVRILPHPDQLDICLTTPHAIANAGQLVPATLAQRLRIEQGADLLIDLGNRPGAANPGRKLLTLTHAMLAGGDCIDDAVRREAPWYRVGCEGLPPACRSRSVKLGTA